MTRLAAGAATDVGLVRANNQDNLLVAELLYAVADGMGGHAAGEVASETAVGALQSAFGDHGGPLDLAQAVQTANRAVWDEAQANPEFRGMGTTLTVLALVEEDSREVLAIANVGDSRTYRLRGDHFEQLTVDHSLVAELVAEGQIRPDEAETHPQRHVLTRALGVYPDVDVDLLTTEPVVGDRYVLCSDGLSREVTDSQIASVLRRLASPGDAARELVATAKIHGGSDNVTVVVVDVKDDNDVDDPPVEAPVVVKEESPSGTSRGDTEAMDLTAIRAAVAVEDAPPEPEPPDGPAPAPRPPRHRIVTVRVVLFFVALAAIVALAVGGAWWYARSAYFVGLRGDRITIYQGRPGGVLWWPPTVTRETALTTSSVESFNLQALRSGVQEPTLRAADTYVANLRRQAVAAGIGTGSGS